MKEIEDLECTEDLTDNKGCKLFLLLCLVTTLTAVIIIISLFKK